MKEKKIKTKKQAQKNLNKRESGITLIALVVTIVVLLILAGITITFVLGEGGILDMAKEAAKRTNEAKEQELKDFADFQNQVENWINGETSNGGTGESGTEPTPEGTTPTPEQSTTKTLAEAKAESEPFKETTEVKVGENDTMTVPGGFRVKEGDSIDEGIVITDSAGETGNEFVWVPVGNINSMVWCKDHVGSEITYEDGELFCDGDGQKHTPSTTQLAGKLYATSTGESFTAGIPNTTFSSSGLREPDILTSSTYGDTDANLSKYLQPDLTQTAFKEQLQNEFYEMAKSVGKYGGFYVGRYETSLPEGSSKSESKAGVKSLYNDSDHNWYVQYKCNKAYAEENKNLAVVSSTIWGCQYDAMMNWMLNNGITVTSTTPTANVERNEDSAGRITGATGSKDKLCNIYDLLGNSFEWTMEAYYPDCCKCQ